MKRIFRNTVGPVLIGLAGLLSGCDNSQEKLPPYVVTGTIVKTTFDSAFFERSNTCYFSVRTPNGIERFGYKEKWALDMYNQLNIGSKITLSIPLVRENGVVLFDRGGLYNSSATPIYYQDIQEIDGKPIQ